VTDFIVAIEDYYISDEKVDVLAAYLYLGIIMILRPPEP
jgi:hypothetical protein